MGTPHDNWKKGRAEIPLYDKKVPTVAVELKDGRVTVIHPCSDLLCFIFTGDIIESVNGQKVSTTAEMTAAVLSKVPGKVIIEYRRDEHCTFNLKPLPPQRSGFDMFEITLMWRSGGTPVGLLIHRDFGGQVVIAMVETGSTASKVIRPGDYLLSVNNTPVIERDMARKLIMTSINTNKKVTMILERQTLVITAATSIMAPPPPDPSGSPMQPPTVTTSDLKVSGNVNKKLDVLLPDDVLAIMEKNKCFFKAEPPSGPALKKIKGPSGGAHAELVHDKHELIPIPFDPSPKQLKYTPKRVGS